MGSYFVNAKSRLSNAQRAYSIGIDARDGNASEMDHIQARRESKNSYVARVSASADRRARFQHDVIDAEDYSSILTFAPETERCYCGCWRMNHNNPAWYGDRWLYVCKCDHGNFHNNVDFPA